VNSFHWRHEEFYGIYGDFIGDIDKHYCFYRKKIKDFLM
jgi:hypothetical protein